MSLSQGPDKKPMEWKQFAPNEENYMYLSHEKLEMRRKLRDHKVQLWNILLPRMLRHSAEVAKQLETLCACSTFWTCLAVIILLAVLVVVLFAIIILSKRHKVLYSELLKGKKRNNSEENTIIM